MLEVGLEKQVAGAFGPEEFQYRHIGPDSSEIHTMLAALGANSLDSLLDSIVPESIREDRALRLSPAASEQEALAELAAISGANQVFRSFIGQGYYNSFTPPVIQRNVLENPAWYTAYTPYQPEISQGRLEAILNFQTLVSELTGMELANASMLDEATAAAEAMTLCKRQTRSRSDCFFVDQRVLPQTIAVIQTRAQPLGIEIVCGDAWRDYRPEECFGVLVQYPGVDGGVLDFSSVAQAAHAERNLVVAAADLLALVMLTQIGRAHV